MKQTVFNAAQLEMLDAMSRINTEEELMELKQAISEYYARRADEEMERLQQSGQWSQQKLEELKTAHYRTPYKQ